MAAEIMVVQEVEPVEPAEALLLELETLLQLPPHKVIMED
jgi:hypothetical protein